MGRQASEDVLEVREGIDIVVLAGAGESVQDGRRQATTVTPQERPVFASERLGTEYPLGEVVVDAQLPVLGIAAERRPVRLRVGDRLTDRALGQCEATLFGQPLPEGRQQRDRIPLPQGTTVLGRELPGGTFDLVELPDARQRGVRKYLRGGPRLEDLQPDVSPSRDLHHT